MLTASICSSVVGKLLRELNDYNDISNVTGYAGKLQFELVCNHYLVKFLINQVDAQIVITDGSQTVQTPIFVATEHENIAGDESKIILDHKLRCAVALAILRCKHDRPITSGAWD